MNTLFWLVVAACVLTSPSLAAASSAFVPRSHTSSSFKTNEELYQPRPDIGVVGLVSQDLRNVNSYAKMNLHSNLLEPLNQGDVLKEDGEKQLKEVAKWVQMSEEFMESGIMGCPFEANLFRSQLHTWHSMHQRSLNKELSQLKLTGSADKFMLSFRLFLKAKIVII